MDRITKEQRSKLMSKIKGKNTKPERLIFGALEEKNIKFEKHYKLLGNPDIVFPDLKIAAFVDGDFWHGHFFDIRREKLPKYWVDKIKRNMKRDKKYTRQLKKDGWVVIRLWEKAILKNTQLSLNRIIKAINSVRHP